MIWVNGNLSGDPINGGFVALEAQHNGLEERGVGEEGDVLVWWLLKVIFTGCVLWVTSHENNPSSDVVLSRAGKWGELNSQQPGVSRVHQHSLGM